MSRRRISTRAARSIRRGILTYRAAHATLRPRLLDTPERAVGRLVEFSETSRALSRADPLAHLAFWEYRRREIERKWNPFIPFDI